MNTIKRSYLSKTTRRNVEKQWNNKCAICNSQENIEIHHLLPISKGGNNDESNLLLLCGCCHAAVHGNTYNSDNYRKNISIDYEKAKPILEAYFSNQIGTKETKEKLNLSQKTHLSECSVYKRYKREHNIEEVHNNIDRKKRKELHNA